MYGRGQDNLYLWLRKRGFPKQVVIDSTVETLRVLCANCNMARGWYGYCPHKEPDRSKEEFPEATQLHLGEEMDDADIPIRVSEWPQR